MLSKTIKEVRDLETVNLVKLLEIASQENNQTIINMAAYELTCRMYVPFNRDGLTFESILDGFGYKPIEKENVKNKTFIR